MDDNRDAALLEELAETLWQERHLMEVLLYRLVCTRLLLAADDERFTGMAVTEVEGVIERLRTAEHRRDDVVQALAVRWGVSIDEFRLATLVERSPEPWRGIFDDHRRMFLELTGEIEDVAMDNRRLADSGLHRIQQTMLVLTGGGDPAGTYSSDGHAASTTGRASVLDQAL